MMHAAITPAGVGHNVLSDLDRTVVWLSRQDPPGSAYPSHGAAIAAALFGAQPARWLADPRLEDLRRYAVLYRAGRQRGAAMLPMGSHALTDAEMTAVKAIVDGWHFVVAAPPSGRAWLVPTALAAAVLCLVSSGVL